MSRSSEDSAAENARVLGSLERAGNALTIVRLLANSPNGFVPYVQMSNALLNRATLPARHRELAILHLAAMLENPYEWAEHARMSAAAGVDEDERRAIRAHHLESALFDDADRLAMRLAEMLHNGAEIDSGQWDAALSTWGKEAVLDLVFTTAWWGGFIPIVIQALGLGEADAGVVETSEDDA